VYTPTSGGKAETFTSPLPHRAHVLHFDDKGTPLNPRTMEAPAQAEGEAIKDDVIVQGSRATRVFDAVPDEIPDAGESAELEGGTEVEKVRLNASRKISEQGAELAALRAQLHDVLNAQRGTTEMVGHSTVPSLAPPDLTSIQKEIDAIGQNFLDDIPGNIKKLTELSAKAAQASVMPLVNQKEEKAALEATRNLVKQYPGLVTNGASAAYVDTLASEQATREGAQQPSMEHYETALNSYAQLVGWTKPASGPVANAEVEQMREAASRTAPAAASVKSKGKIWRKPELDALLTRHPDKYRDMQAEIMRAYREGRVK
jgi:hypothetical protein